MRILIIIYYMSVRPSEIIVMRNHFTKGNLLPPCERGRLEKGSLLFLIILNFTPSLSPPLLLPPLKFSVESLSAGHASPVTWCLKYTTRMVAYPHLSTHSFWNITWNDLIFCTGALLSMPYGSTVGKIKIVSGHGTPVTWCLKDTTKSINELWIIMPENRPYPLFSSFFRSFIIFEFLPLIEPAALRIPLQLTLLLWWYCRRANAAHSLAVALRCPAACIGLHLGNAPDHCPNRCLG